MATKRKPKILMLGWEYPPLLSGGLGMASQGLGQALAPHTELEMVVPMTFPDVPNAILNPRDTWRNESEYDEVASDLALRFIQNFKAFEDKTSDEIVQAGPVPLPV